MDKKLQKLKDINEKALSLAWGIDVNCEESSRQFTELNGLAKDLGALINELTLTDKLDMTTTSFINFNNRNFVKVIGGKKRTTLRLGDRSYPLGRCGFMCDGQPVPEVGEITEVRKVRFSSLSFIDAGLHGYNNIEELKAELESCYKQEIQGSDVITVVSFKIEVKG